MKTFDQFINNKTDRKTINIGGRTYLLPFKQTGNWVEDAKKNSVAECYNNEVAKALAHILNEKY